MLGKSFVAKGSILLAIVALLAVACLGQTFYGSLVGTVTDSSGAVIQGAAATLTNTGTGERRTSPTGADGIYRFVNLVPGNYKMEVEHAGFKHYTQDQILVNVEATVRADVAMQVGEVTQSFQVTAEAALLQTENASLSQVVTARTVQELPLNGRNVLNLVTMVPGVVPQGSSDGSLTGKNVFAAGNYQIGGGTANQSATLYDGIPMTTTYGNLVALVPSQDAVAEFRVQTNNNSAEYGRFTGGVVNMTSKSGNNQFHGDTFEYLRNKVLNANTFFSNRSGLTRPPFVQNQFGSSLGGPIKKDKLFFFFGYEGFRQRAGNTFTDTVPTALMVKGDFSDYRNAAGAQIIIYDPLTQCGQYNNPACVTGQPQRSPFPNNVIPTNRINPVSLAYVNYPAFSLPTDPGAANTHNFNFNKNAATGGNNDQYTSRGDWYVNDQQRILARYTRWKSANLPVNPYGNGFLQGDPYSPEGFTTDQAILADTYSLSPTTILDVRLGFMRWFYGRIPGHVGTDLPKTFGFPAYMNTIDAGNGFSNSSTPPYLAVSGYNFIGGGLLYSRDNSYTLTASLIKIHGRHTLKFGGEGRRMDINYFQNNQPGGIYTFDNLFTAATNAGGGTGGSFASFLLGDAAGGIQQIAPFTAGGMRYQGYYANDTFQATQALTLNYGVRWEIPGVYTERFNNLATFDPSLINPATAGVLVNGQPVKGAFVLVNTPGHPERGLRPEQFKKFAPRLGIAYRLNDKTVIRTGAGIFYAPANVNFPEGPCQSAVNYVINQMVATNNSSVTPVNTLSNAFPNGFVYAPGRNPNFQQRLLGVASVKFPQEHVNYPYTIQWNFTIQHQFPGDLAVEASYVGLKGTNLSQGAAQINALPTSLLSMGQAALQQQVPNPLYGLASNGTITQPTVQRGQLLLPYPQYTSGADPGAYMGNSTYDALQAKVEKRFAAGGTLLAAYTFSKVISNVETLTTWLDGPTGVAGVQDWYNLRNERAISSFDSRTRLTFGYVVDLPFGKGKKLLPGVKGVADKIVSGWGVNGLTTFQDGFPLGLTATPNLTGFNTGLRPNVVAGCNPVIGGAIQQRLNQSFNTSCYSVPGAFTFGSEGRTDPVLRGAGVNNFNASIFKKTTLGERFKLEFRAEAFNLFNRVQFGNPGLVASTAAGNTFGIISTQLNSPRLIQLALKLTY